MQCSCVLLVVWLPFAYHSCFPRPVTSECRRMQSWLVRTQPYVDHQLLRDPCPLRRKGAPACVCGGHVPQVYTQPFIYRAGFVPYHIVIQ